MACKFVVIDPRRTRSAQDADWHIPIRIGTDAALALGIMHVLVRDGLCDRDYIARHTLGFDRVEREVLPRFTPDRVASVTGMAAADVERLAAMYGAAKKSFIRLGWGMTRFTYGGQALRTVALLPGVTGAYGRYGGGALNGTDCVVRAELQRGAQAIRPGGDAHHQPQPARRGAAGAERSADPRAVHRREQSGGHLPRHRRRRDAAWRARTCSPWCTIRS